MDTEAEVVKGELAFLDLRHQNAQAFSDEAPRPSAIAPADGPNHPQAHVVGVAAGCVELEAQASRLAPCLYVTQRRRGREVALKQITIEYLEDDLPHMNDQVAQALPMARANEGALAHDLLDGKAQLRVVRCHLFQLQHDKANEPL